MREIQLKDAKATLSAVLDEALGGEEFAITRHYASVEAANHAASG
jgi:antitoxin (DNA-binding transcriptional repressor) of toxin-antitoxin stability system